MAARLHSRTVKIAACGPASVCRERQRPGNLACMKFGPCPTEHAEHAILAHSLRAGERLFKKGHVLSGDDLALMRSSGIREVAIARLEDGDLAEDIAAMQIAKRLAGEHVRVAAAFTGRANLFAVHDGVAVIDPVAIAAINATNESITVATLAPFVRVSQRQMLATVKIIPFAAPREAVRRIEQLLAARPAISVAPFRARRAALILTTPPATRPALVDKTRAAVSARVRDVGSEL